MRAFAESRYVVSSIRRLLMLGLAVAAAMPVAPLNAAPRIHKCETGGKVTYQSDPCPSAQAQRRPTVQELNAKRRERDPSALAGPERSSGQSPAASGPRAERAQNRVQYRCDGRVYCSQMTSCAEAKYFLKHCPGVKMDGDGDGIPCESQWCGG